MHANDYVLRLKPTKVAETRRHCWCEQADLAATLMQQGIDLLAGCPAVPPMDPAEPPPRVVSGGRVAGGEFEELVATYVDRLPADADARTASLHLTALISALWVCLLRVARRHPTVAHVIALSAIPIMGKIIHRLLPKCQENSAPVR